MLSPGDVVSYLEMCTPFGMNLQRGMNFRLTPNESLILMSVRPGAPYKDRVEQAGKVIIYEGHDVPRSRNGLNPKTVDQPEFQPKRKANTKRAIHDGGAALQAEPGCTGAG